MTPPLHPEFAPIAFTSALLTLLPLPWHWRARNAATLSIIAWLLVSNIIFAVDATLWGNNVDIKARVWCDISTKLIVGANFALPAACLCICVHLEHVASGRTIQAVVADKRRQQMFELAMCFGLPIIFMVLHYIVQGHRFDIIQGYGCRPSTYYSIPALFIIWFPPIILAIIALAFAGLALRHFIIRRLIFASLLSASQPSLSTSHYMRLMLMAYFQMICWADVHSDFGRIDRYLGMEVPPYVQTAYYVGWWLIPVSTWVFVGFFAFGRDAVEEYKKCFVWIQNSVVRILSSTPKKDKLSSVVSSSPSPKAIYSFREKNLPATPTSVLKGSNSSTDDSTIFHTLPHALDIPPAFPVAYISDPERQHDLPAFSNTRLPLPLSAPTVSRVGILTPLPHPRRPRAQRKSRIDTGA
ncbi:hypothetical protein NP233_g5863 [Leucocoprinus birnbaumii]|uniref:Pheromone receptor n=1 Tax=Leucocoprinus birnbaumii TaxID=56174 RepID=A0AAD5VS37_9AGAR|nr:hypothetical protein NP233_g5863 [Leucocoprinus birnbaumii]